MFSELTLHLTGLTPVQKTPQAMNYNSSPEIDYFRPAAVLQPKKDSRWKDDWEELELLGRGAFGSVVKAKNKLDGAIYAGELLSPPPMSIGLARYTVRLT